MLAGPGDHFHIASDMDVRQIRVRFFALKSAKGVFLASIVCKGCHFQAIKVSNLRKIINFFDQITEVLRNLFNSAKIYSSKFIFRRFGVYIFENFPPFVCEGSKILPKFWFAKGKGLKVTDAHPYPPLYRSSPRVSWVKTYQISCLFIFISIYPRPE